MSNKFRHTLLTLFLAFLSASLGAQEVIDSTVVVSRRNQSLVVPGNGVQSLVRTELLRRAPSLLGNADPVRFVHWLPGVSTGSEMDAGIHVQGTEHQHTLVSSEGVPIYGASHLLGLFSVFIPSHYSSMEYRSDSPVANRLGGVVDMKLPTRIPEHLTGSLSSGLLSTEGTLSIPMGRKAALVASARKSYINLLYGKYLKLDDNAFQYDFGDVNLSFLWKPSERDLFWADVYAGRDNLAYNSYENGMDVGMDWYNALFALHWKRRLDEGEVRQSLYHTRLGLGMDVLHDFFSIGMPSHIGTSGYRITYSWPSWEWSVDLAYHRVLPQHVSAEGASFRQNPSEGTQTGLEATLSARYDWIQTSLWTLSTTLKGQLWQTEYRWRPFLSPELNVSYRLSPEENLSASAGIRRQFLFQTGLSSVAFPYEFWLLAGKYSDPQSSLFARLTYDRELDGGAWRFDAELYWHELSNQIEYKGSILDFVREDYALENVLLKGRGRNFGASLMLRKQSGRLTGWAAYTIGRSLRRFDHPSYPDVYPASHERRHEFNLVLSWKAGKWDVGGSFVAAEGTPFTAVESMYVAQNQLICNFGAHNAARFRPYIRLDLSANYYLFQEKDGRACGFNLSIYNATCRRNDIFYKLTFTPDKRFSYSAASYTLSILPSVGFFYRF